MNLLGKIHFWEKSWSYEEPSMFPGMASGLSLCDAVEATKVWTFFLTLIPWFTTVVVHPQHCSTAQRQKLRTCVILTVIHTHLLPEKLQSCGIAFVLNMGHIDATTTYKVQHEVKSFSHCTGPVAAKGTTVWFGHVTSSCSGFRPPEGPQGSLTAWEARGRCHLSLDSSQEPWVNYW